MTPTQCSIKYLKSLGYTVAIVEKWNAHCKIRQDLFGFADLIAFNGTEVILVQTTTDKNFAARRQKVMENPVAAYWAANTFSRAVHVHGWKKVKNKWQVRVHEVEPCPITNIVRRTAASAGKRR